MRSDPLVLHYTIDPSQPPPEKPAAYDVEMRIEDSTLKTRMSHVVTNMTPESAKELAKLDDEVYSCFIFTSLPLKIYLIAIYYRSLCMSSLSKTPTSNEPSFSPSHPTLETSFRRGLSLSRVTLRLSWEAALAKVRRSDRMIYAEASISGCHGLKRLWRFRKACDWPQRPD